MKSTIIKRIMRHDWPQPASLHLNVWVTMIAERARSLILLSTTLGLPSAGLAHAEHSPGERTGVTHFLMEPGHMFPTLAMLLTTAWVVRCAARRFLPIYQKRQL